MPLDSLAVNCESIFLGGRPAERPKEAALHRRSALAEQARVAQQPVLHLKCGAAWRLRRDAEDQQRSSMPRQFFRHCASVDNCAALLRRARRTECAAQHAGAKRQPVTGFTAVDP